MAVAHTAPSAFLSIPPQKLSSFASPKTPFLGFPVAVAPKPFVQARALTLAKPTPNQIRCQGDAVIPKEQKWMFDESNINGPDIWNKTWYPKAADHVNTEKTWYVVDATDKILGRLASTIAIHIRGKNLATYTPSVDMGAFVIVVNAEKVAVSGKKRTQKLYRRHSGRPGGMKVETFDQLQQRIPERIIEHAVRGMLPKGRLGRALFTHLKVYKGPNHPHEAQKPIELPIRDKRVQVQK
ncbi:PREDICTED: 50S ribosomal protein L13, chloroplastic-like [Nelumbo nucifera]|uniref:Large ribosomal subunit protein uL13c n=1 Tax=Nelumbo nucifera TaxID=4432 RepID=A0A1U8BBB9_NELNU|nr:PREDICTED: 50S ribosomal protein L13, chloroplastic-like [Nelumbo nucifera]